MGLREYFKIASQLDPNQYGMAYGLTTMIPVLPDRVDALEAGLEALDPLASPFGALRQAHCVRLLVIRDLVYQGPPQKPEHLNQPYLAFTASFDGELDPFLRDLAALPASREVFSHCAGYVEEPGAFVAWMRSHKKDNGYVLTPWPFKTVQDVQEALRVQEGFQGLVDGARAMGDAELQDAFKALMRATARPEGSRRGEQSPEGRFSQARTTK
jgi:hypothetical protein